MPPPKKRSNEPRKNLNVKIQSFDHVYELLLQKYRGFGQIIGGKETSRGLGIQRGQTNLENEKIIDGTDFSVELKLNSEHNKNLEIDLDKDINKLIDARKQEVERTLNFDELSALVKDAQKKLINEYKKGYTENVLPFMNSSVKELIFKNIDLEDGFEKKEPYYTTFHYRSSIEPLEKLDVSDNKLTNIDFIRYVQPQSININGNPFEKLEGIDKDHFIRILEGSEVRIDNEIKSIVNTKIPEGIVNAMNVCRSWIRESEPNQPLLQHLSPFSRVPYKQFTSLPLRLHEAEILAYHLTENPICEIAFEYARDGDQLILENLAKLKEIKIPEESIDLIEELTTVIGCDKMKYVENVLENNPDNYGFKKVKEYLDNKCKVKVNEFEILL